MTTGRFEDRMQELWEALVAEAARLNDSTFVPFSLIEWYRALKPEERRAADVQLADWILDQDEGKRFDALAVVREFKIASARPQIQHLMRRLQDAEGPGVPFLQDKLLRILTEFGAE